MTAPAPGTLCLAVTSSTSVVGVAVGPAGGAPADQVEAHIATDRRHAEELTPLLRQVLSQAGVDLDRIGCFVVDVGPGRFTGLRVGLTTVRSLALVGQRPVVALTSLEILAGGEAERPLLAVVDARRGEVFQQRFGPDGPDGPAVVGRPEDLAPLGLAVGEGAPARSGSGLVVVGDGADRYQDLYGPGRRPGREPSAAVMIHLAPRHPALPGPEVAPVYLREPDVHINVKTRAGGGAP